MKTRTQFPKRRISLLVIAVLVAVAAASAFSGAAADETKMLTIPSGLKAIPASAFEGDSDMLDILTVPEGVTSIGSRAFAGCVGMTVAYLPDSLVTIADDAFDGCQNLIIVCSQNSVSYQYAIGHNIPVVTTEETTYDITDFGAIPDDGKDDVDAINEATDMAREVSERTGVTVTVVIPSGTFHISGSIFVFSNTHLLAKSGATIQQTVSAGTMVLGAHIDPATGKRCKGNCSGHGTGYTQCNNIIIEGGTWLAGSGSSSGNTTVVGIRHSQNITIKNLTCKNMSGHAVNLSGVNYGRVSGVRFMDQKKDLSDPDPDISYVREAIHLDYCSEEGEPTAGAPYDNTPAKNIVVENCTFTNMYSGVGNHHGVPSGGTISSNITVRNCTFTNMKSYGLCERSVKNLTFTGNTATETPVLVYLSRSSNVTVRGNSVDAGSHTYTYIESKEGKDYTEIYVDQCEDITIEDNTVSNSVYSAVKAYTTVESSPSNRITITGNTISGIKGTGIDVQFGDGHQVKNNTLTGITGGGIYLRATTGTSLTGNSVVSKTDNAVYIVGNKKKGTSSVTVKNNTMNSTKKYDLYLSEYADCTITGNTLKNNTFYWTSNAAYTGDFPEIKTIRLDKSTYTFTGEEIHPTFVVRDAAGTLLKEGTDYRVYYVHCIRADDPQTMIRVTGMPRGMYAGQTVEKPFTISPCKPKSIRVVLSQTTYTYDGTKKTPDVTVYADDEKLTTYNYDVKYDSGRIIRGTYNVRVILKRNYTGEATVSFTIK